MKVRITDPDVIRKREQELFEAISENLDWEALSKVFRVRHRLGSITGMESRQGDLVAREGAVAYRLDFDVRAVLSVLFDRAGNYLSTAEEIELAAPSPLETSAEAVPIPQQPRPEAEADRSWKTEEAKKGVEKEEEEEETIDLHQIVRVRSDLIQDPAGLSAPRPRPKTPPNVKMSRIAHELADMISDINGSKKS
jgi:hypothetical protein